MEMMAPVAAIRITGAVAVAEVQVQQAIVAEVQVEIHMLAAPEEPELRLRLQALRLFMLAVVVEAGARLLHQRWFMTAALAVAVEEVQVLKVTRRQRLAPQILVAVAVAVD
jgi:hypothetical protein